MAWRFAFNNPHTSHTHSTRSDLVPNDFLSSTENPLKTHSSSTEYWAQARIQHLDGLSSCSHLFSSSSPPSFDLFSGSSNPPCSRPRVSNRQHHIVCHSLHPSGPPGPTISLLGSRCRSSKLDLRSGTNRTRHWVLGFESFVYEIAGHLGPPLERITLDDPQRSEYDSLSKCSLSTRHPPCRRRSRRS